MRNRGMYGPFDIRDYFMYVTGGIPKRIPKPPEPFKPAPIPPEALDVPELQELGFPQNFDNKNKDVDIPEELKKGGLDVLAFYCPYHYFGDNWGIYYYDWKIKTFADMISAACSLGAKDVHKLVLRVITQHELLHFQIEYAATINEEITRIHSKYAKIQSTGSLKNLEEALANAYAFLEIRLRSSKKLRSSGFQHILEAKTMQLPGGYGEYWRYMDWRNLRIGLARLLSARQPSMFDLIIPPPSRIMRQIPKKSAP